MDYYFRTERNLLPGGSSHSVLSWKAFHWVSGTPWTKGDIFGEPHCRLPCDGCCYPRTRYVLERIQWHRTMGNPLDSPTDAGMFHLNFHLWGSTCAFFQQLPWLMGWINLDSGLESRFVLVLLIFKNDCVLLPAGCANPLREGLGWGMVSLLSPEGIQYRKSGVGC